jgi:hypothetical protein
LLQVSDQNFVCICNFPMHATCPPNMSLHYAFIRNTGLVMLPSQTRVHCPFTVTGRLRVELAFKYTVLSCCEDLWLYKYFPLKLSDDLAIRSY